jgi:uncharacterized protein
MYRNLSSDFVKLATVIFIFIILSGCAAFSSYDRKTGETVSAVQNGEIELALEKHENQREEEKKKLLYHLEKGSLLQIKGDTENSIQSLMEADKIVQIWEEKAKLNPGKVLEGIGSSIINDKVITYEGTDYEKVFVTTDLAILQSSEGNWDKARTEIKKTHEREAVISNFNEKKYAKVEKESEGNDVQVSSYKELNGYPVEIFNDPAVLNLKNSYQNALSHYLAGYVYEALGEPSLAAPGYRKAIELNPNATILDDALKNLDRRSNKKLKRKADVLFIVKSGFVPAKKSMTIPIPVFTSDGLLAAPISFPYLKSNTLFHPSALTVDSREAALHTVVNVDAMAKRELKDRMPGIILRSTIRATLKAVAQKEVQERDALFGLALMLVNVVSESADERMWRLLPSSTLLARTSLDYGEHTVTIGANQFQINVTEPYNVIPIRVVGNLAYLELPKTGVNDITTTVAQAQ